MHRFIIKESLSWIHQPEHWFPIPGQVVPTDRSGGVKPSGLFIMLFMLENILLPDILNRLILIIYQEVHYESEVREEQIHLEYNAGGYCCQCFADIQLCRVQTDFKCIQKQQQGASHILCGYSGKEGGNILRCGMGSSNKYTEGVMEYLYELIDKLQLNKQAL